MDVNDIVCLGFGSWSNINAVVTLGYSIGTAVAMTMEGRCMTVLPNRLITDSTRTLVAQGLSGENVSYAFEETEVS